MFFISKASSLLYSKFDEFNFILGWYIYYQNPNTQNVHHLLECRFPISLSEHDAYVSDQRNKRVKRRRQD